MDDGAALVVGIIDISILGITDGIMDGVSVLFSLLPIVGFDDNAEGNFDGNVLGSLNTVGLGDCVGFDDGTFAELAVGIIESNTLGIVDGIKEGFSVSFLVLPIVGLDDVDGMTPEEGFSECISLGETDVSLKKGGTVGGVDVALYAVGKEEGNPLGFW
eukprot:8788558-Ditylum_brightwellii.AAC.1